MRDRVLDTTTKEYCDIYPKLLKDWQDKLVIYKKDMLNAMNEVNQKIGDRVTYDLLGAFYTISTLAGIIVEKEKGYYVKLDTKINGKRFIKWHKGFRKTSYDIGGEKNEKRGNRKSY